MAAGIGVDDAPDRIDQKHACGGIFIFERVLGVRKSGKFF
jgi:hypothetical protein